MAKLYMESYRREFLAITGAAAATTIGVEAVREESDEDVKLQVDLEKMHREVEGKDLYANIYAEADKEGLEDFRVEILEPGEEAWKVLDQDNVTGDQARLDGSYNPENFGEYRFRAVAITGNETYQSDQERLEVIR